MNFDLPDDHRLLQRTVRDFADAGGGARRPRSSTGPSRSPTSSSRSWASSGWMGIPFPEEVGGAGGDDARATRSPSRSSRASTRSVAITMCAHTSLGTQPVYLFGSEEQKQALLPDLCAGRQARRVRPDRARGRLRRRQRQDARELDGGEWVSTAPSSSSPTPAPTSPGTSRSPRGPARTEISNIIVENGTPGYEQGEPYRKMGWNASDTRPLTFDGLPRAGGEPARPARRRASSSSSTSSTSAGSASPRWASASRRARSTRRSNTPRSAARSASRSRSSRRSRASSPTWPTEIEAARLLDLQGRVAEGRRAGTSR